MSIVWYQRVWRFLTHGLKVYTLKDGLHVLHPESSVWRVGFRTVLVIALGVLCG